MKREGRQHGVVRTYRITPWSPRPYTRFVNKLDSLPNCGVFTKVPQKPTNHSKFTGKCGKVRCMECHMHPACRSKDKTKGTRKFINSCDLVSNYKMITWRVMNGQPNLNFSKVSATEILDHLDNDYVDDNDDDDHDDGSNDAYDHDGPYDDEIREIVNRNDDDGNNNYNNHNDEDQDVISYYDVAFDQVYGEDEGWCLLGEM